jgi:hypothetical protein
MDLLSQFASEHLEQLAAEMDQGSDYVLRKETDWVSFYRDRAKFGFDAFVFVKDNFAWRSDDTVLVGSEDIYGDDDDSDDDVPAMLRARGFRFLATGSEIRTAYDDTWVVWGGLTSFEEFNKSVRYYCERDAFRTPEEC